MSKSNPLDADVEAIKRRLRLIEDALREFSVDLSSINAQLATIRASHAVKAREEKKQKEQTGLVDLTPEEVLRAMMRGYEIVKVNVGAPNDNRNNFPKFDYVDHKPVQHVNSDTNNE